MRIAATEKSSEIGPGCLRVAGALVAAPVLQPLFGNLFESVFRGDYDGGLLGFALSHRVDSVDKLFEGRRVTLTGVG